MVDRAPGAVAAVVVGVAVIVHAWGAVADGREVVRAAVRSTNWPHIYLHVREEMVSLVTTAFCSTILETGETCRERLESCARFPFGVECLPPTAGRRENIDTKAVEHRIPRAVADRSGAACGWREEERRKEKEAQSRGEDGLIYLSKFPHLDGERASKQAITEQG